jgi:hypothetical protein
VATQAIVNSSPAIGADGTVYAGTDAGLLNPHDGRTGRTNWVFDTSPGAISASPAIGPDGTVYIGNNLGFFVAVQGQAGLAQSPWPKFRGAASNLGRQVVEPAAAPRFESMSISAAGYRVAASAVAGQKYQVQVSDDLLSWKPLTTLTASNSAIEFTDGATTTPSRRFYRLQLVP